MAEPGTSFGQRLQAALVDSLLAAIITFALFSLLLGFRTVDNVTGLTLQPRPTLLAVADDIADAPLLCIVQPEAMIASSRRQRRDGSGIGQTLARRPSDQGAV